MKKNVRFMLKIAIISALFIMVVAARAFAAEVNMNNIDFTNIPETGTSTTGNTTGSGNTSTTGNTTSSGNTANTNTSSNTTEKKNTSTSSSSNTKMPATGSNLEIIFGVVAIVVISGAIFFYRKQNIKLK